MLFSSPRVRPRRGRTKKFFLPWPGFSLGRETWQGIGIIFLLVALFATGLSLAGKAGAAGYWVNAGLEFVFGAAKWSLPVLFGLAAWGLTKSGKKQFDGANVFGLFLFLACASSWLYFFQPESGGWLGRMLTEAAMPYVGPSLAALLFSSGLIVSWLLILDTSISRLLGRESWLYKFFAWLFESLFLLLFGGEEEDEDEDEDEEEDKEKNREEAGVKEYEILEENEACEEEAGLTRKNIAGKDFNQGQEKNKPESRGWPKSRLKINIPTDLLKNKPQKPVSGDTRKNQEIIRDTFRDFGVAVSMADVTVGPTVTQYAIRPNKGVSVSRIKTLADDLALNLAVHPVRIEAPIPGKSLIGLEVPNQAKVAVSLKEIIKSKAFSQRKANTIVPLGRDVAGRIIMDDLVKMPHILVAGATNSGKSVFLHALILSLIFQNNPDDLKFILIDQKQVELSLYDDMPYLAAPVITEHKRAIRALAWGVGEMERRLKLINSAHCQNIADYNRLSKTDSLPYLVIVVDELGDLLSAARKEAEGAIIRLGQKARAAGIHLVLATQRPSVDILSGLVKANMPARAAFSVTSSLNSKTILDFTGAEKLMGQGDMLYINSSMGKPVRVQGAFVSKEEIKAVVGYVKKEIGRARYAEDFEQTAAGDKFFSEDEGEADEMLEQAREMIITSRRASATMLQSRLGIGYPRANRLLDVLEKQGVVGPSIQNKPREVLIGK